MVPACLFLFIATVPKFCSGSGDNTLELVHVIFRHGQRTPEKILLYPKDPNINASYYPSGYGLLTNTGKLQEYMLGKELRRRYIEFLKPFSMDIVAARSTDAARAKMSLQLVLASLFPPEDDFLWHESFQWQPIPSTYKQGDKDHVLGSPYHNCPRYFQLYWKFLKSDAGLDMYRNHSGTIKYIAEHSGINTTSRGLFNLYFVLAMEAENGFQLPNWTNSVYPKFLEEMVFLEYHARGALPEMLRLGSGFLLKKIIADTRLKIKRLSPENRKIYLYSGHEFNLISLLKLLEVYTRHIPPYGAYISIEIHNIGGVRHVEVYYQGDKTKNPRKLELPDCPKLCRFDRFVEEYKKYLPGSKKECARKPYLSSA